MVLASYDPAWRFHMLARFDSFDCTPKEVIAQTPELGPLLLFRDHLRLLAGHHELYSYRHREAGLCGAFSILEGQIYPRGLIDAFYLVENGMKPLEQHTTVTAEVAEIYGFLFWSPAVIQLQRRTALKERLAGRRRTNCRRVYVDYALRKMALQSGLGLVLRIVNPFAEWTTADDQALLEFVQSEFAAGDLPPTLDVAMSPTKQRVRSYLQMREYLVEYNDPAAPDRGKQRSGLVDSLLTCIGSLLGVPLYQEQVGKKQDSTASESKKSEMVEFPDRLRRRQPTRDLEDFLRLEPELTDLPPAGPPYKQHNSGDVAH